MSVCPMALITAVILQDICKTEPRSYYQKSSNYIYIKGT